MIVAVNGSVTPSVTRLRWVLVGTAAAAFSTCLLAVASALELLTISLRCALVMFSSPESVSNVLPIDARAGASARSACPC